MAKVNNKRVVSLKPTSFALFQGSFAAIIGLGLAILYSLHTTVHVASATDSVLKGLTFGLASGALSIIVLPFVYFAFDWLIGLVQGWVFNAVLGVSGGLVFGMEDEK